MKRVLGILALVIIFVMCIVNFSSAAEEVAIKIDNNKSVAKPGDEITFTLSLLNGSTIEIGTVIGVIEYDESVFELVTLDYDTVKEEVDSTTGLILDEIEKQEFQLLGIYEDWIISFIDEYEQDGKTLENVIIAMAPLNPLKNSSSYTEIGEIKLKVKDSTMSKTTKVSISSGHAASISSTDATEEPDTISIKTATSQSITVNGGDNGDIEDIPSLDPTDDEFEEDDEDAPIDDNDEQQDSQEADTEAPDTGIEDVIPFIVIAVICGFIGYIKYSKYQGI